MVKLRSIINSLIEQDRAVHISEFSKFFTQKLSLSRPSSDSACTTIKMRISQVDFMRQLPSSL